MNKVFLVGRLTRDPELRYTVNNVAVCRFSLAVDRPKQDDKEQKADFLNCVAYDKLGENITKYQNKGNQLAIAGRIQTGSYEAQDGTKRYTTDIVVNEAQFLTTKAEQQNSGQETETAENPKHDLEPYKQMAAKIEMDEDYNPEMHVEDGELPF